MHIRQPAVGAVVQDGEFLVVDAQQVEQGGVQVVDGGFVLGGLVGEVVAGAEGGAALHAGAGHPGDTGAAVVVAADAALRERHAAELGGP